MRRQTCSSSSISAVGERPAISTIHRFKGLESPVVILAEIDSRVPAEQLPGLLYVGATRARTHLVVIGSAAIVDPSVRIVQFDP